MAGTTNSPGDITSCFTIITFRIKPISSSSNSSKASTTLPQWVSIIRFYTIPTKQILHHRFTLTQPGQATLSQANQFRPMLFYYTVLQLAGIVESRRAYHCQLPSLNGLLYLKHVKKVFTSNTLCLNYFSQESNSGKPIPWCVWRG